MPSKLFDYARSDAQHRAVQFLIRAPAREIVKRVFGNADDVVSNERSTFTGSIFVLAELGGADPRAVCNALQGGFADSTVLRQHGARMLDGRFDPGAHCTTQLKDLSTALALGSKLGGNFPLLTLCTELYATLCRSNRQSLDHSALYLEARDRTPLGSS
jgi:hypothetical protein